jgi:hypothetical protein
MVPAPRMIPVQKHRQMMVFQKMALQMRVL